MDVASRRVLGFSLGEHHDAGNACGALAMAGQRAAAPCPTSSCTPIGAAEYTAGTFQQAC
jgi:putative transposase